MMRTIALIPGVLLCAGVAAAEPETYIYRFDLRVTENTALNAPLTQIPVGTTGTFELYVNSDPTIFAADGNASNAYYQVLDFQFDVGPLSSGPTPGVFPSQHPLTGLRISNTVTNGDAFAVLTPFADISTGFSQLLILDYSTNPDLFRSVELPTSINLPSANDRFLRIVEAQQHGSKRVTLGIDAVTVTIIPNTATGVLFAISGILATKRRRNGT